MEDANSWDEQERRRAQFGRWLLKAWEWAIDTARHQLALDIAELHSHVEEIDYPLWVKAGHLGLIGDGKIASLLRRAHGTPVMGPVANDWERQINFSPVIYLEEKLWRHIHGSLGWVNRYTDTKVMAPNFWLWSSASNRVYFIMRSATAPEGE